ncbi:MAG TPA: phosphatase PAP2 family protein [Gemmatimonadaceae bacterium]
MNLPIHGDRRETRRGVSRRFWDVVFFALRLIARRAKSATAVFGIFLIAGAIVAVAGTWGFAELARHVEAGSTKAFDVSVMQWIGRHQDPAVQAVMLEITTLGTSTVVAAIVLVAAMFLWLSRHKHSAFLLCVATLGGIVLNNLLKLGFDRPRPQVFAWGTRAVSSSFPSGHAMSAAIAYSTVAYLAARLQRNARSRVLTMVVAAVIVLLICLSRLYLGVHYPSDVIAGVTIGLAWAAFCMAVLEATQLYARRNAPELLLQEKPAPPRGG